MTAYLYDPIRRLRVIATPEEIVRQALLKKMVEELGFPKGHLSIEAKVGGEGRRADIICYALLPELSPLLIVECKAKTVSLDAEAQAFGYNVFLKAPFICLAAGEEILTIWHQMGQVQKVPFLPRYEELCAAARSRIT